MMIAVPVSWQLGRIMPAETHAFCSMVRATNRSFSVASGSSRILESCARWPGRKRCEMVWTDSAINRVSAWRSTSRIRLPRYSPTETKSPVSFRNGTSGFGCGNMGWYLNSGIPIRYASRLLTSISPAATRPTRLLGYPATQLPSSRENRTAPAVADE